ncbi:Phenylalanine--tRNA ligase beta subunit [Bienertia sinuspersici]
MNVDCSIKDVIFQEPDSNTVSELLKVDEKAIVINSIDADAGATVTEEGGTVTVGDHSKNVPEEVFVSSTKDNDLVVPDGDVTDSIPESVQRDETNDKENDDVVLSRNSSEHTPSPLEALYVNEAFVQILPLKTPWKVQCPHVDGSYSSTDLSAPIPDVTTPEYVQQKTPEKVKEYIDEDIPGIKNDDSFPAKTEDSRKGQLESSETIDTYKALPVTIHDIYASRTLQLIFDFTQSTKMCQENPDIHVCMSNTDFLSLAPRTWLTRASIDACSYEFYRREEENPGNLRKFSFNLLPFNYINWLVDERKKKDSINSIIAEIEIDLEKAKDNPHYDTKCRQSMSSREKFPHNNIRHADLILVPTHLDNHFAVLVFNAQKSMIEDIDNRSDNKYSTRYGEKPYDRVNELCCILQSFLQGNQIKHRGFNGLHHWKKRTIPFPWRTSRIAVIVAYTLNLVRCQLAIYLVSYKENKKKEQALKDCALWSTTNQSLV